MSIEKWSARLTEAGASAGELDAITASYQDAQAGVQDALDGLIAGIDRAGVLAMLTSWRAGDGPFGDGFPGGGLPFGTHAAILTGNPADDAQAIGAGTGVKLAVGGAGAAVLTPTAVKTIAYSAAAGELVGVDASGATALVTLPTAPVDKTQVMVVVVAQAAPPNAVTVACGGLDVFGTAGGPGSLVLSALGAGAIAQYQASVKVWHVTALSTPLDVASGAAKLGSDATIAGPGGSALSNLVEKRAAAIKSADYTILAADSLLLGDVSGASRTFTLPAAVGSGRRHKLGISLPSNTLDSPNVLTVAPGAGDRIGAFALGAPVLASLVAGVAGSGSLDAATYWATVTAVSEEGETLASNELSAVSAVALLAAPVISSVVPSTSGGHLTDAVTYTYQVASISAAGESTPSAAVAVTMGSGGNLNSNAVSWGAVAAATAGFAIYRYSSQGLSSQRFTVGAGVNTFTDTLAWSGSRFGVWQDVNLTGVALSATWADVPGARFYRYRRGTASAGENQIYEVFATVFVDQGLPAFGQGPAPGADGTPLTVGTPRSGAEFSEVELADAANNSWRIA